MWARPPPTTETEVAFTSTACFPPGGLDDDALDHDGGAGGDGAVGE